MKRTLAEDIQSELNLALARRLIPQSKDLDLFLKDVMRELRRFYWAGVNVGLQAAKDYQGRLRDENGGFDPSPDGEHPDRYYRADAAWHIQATIERVTGAYDPEEE